MIMRMHFFFLLFRRLCELALEKKSLQYNCYLEQQDTNFYIPVQTDCNVKLLTIDLGILLIRNDCLKKQIRQNKAYSFAYSFYCIRVLSFNFAFRKKVESWYFHSLHK